MNDTNRSVSKYVKPNVMALDREVIRDELADRLAYLRLDKNENLHAFDDEPFESFRQTISQELVWGYPNLRPLYEKFAQQNGVGTDQVLLGNGSDVAIKALFDACISPADEIILHAPSYFMFSIYAQLAGAEVVSIPVRDWLPDLERMKAAVGPKTKLMVMEDPSGFVGTSITVPEMRELAQYLHARGVLLLIDEAYLYVGGDRSEHMPLLAEFDNVIISRTMSKAHGLAGARVGFLMSNPELMAHIVKCRPLYEISALSAHFAEWVLDHPEYVEEYREMVTSSKAKIFAALDDLDVRYRDTRGNFVLVHCDRITPDEMVSSLAAQGILVRRPFTDAQFTDWVRVTVSGPWATRKFIEAFQKVKTAGVEAENEADALSTVND
ncbi:pyridoxal phosphate-dependent aminotransferase [Lysobacter brunescens]|uniref:histidinol-phosphate transaminase n=1 Tax=Lysobacter brunescens TaxID=262323 RepID=A0A6B7LPL4_9GAMM|nr:putative kynurenine aminotransferase [Lysobacter brunescens]